MSDQFQVNPRPPVPRVQAPTLDPAHVQELINLGVAACDRTETIALYNTAMKFRADVPPQILAMLAAVGLVANRVADVVNRLAPPREGATEDELIAELPEWAREVLTAVGLIDPPEGTEPPEEEDIVTRAARSNLLIGR